MNTLDAIFIVAGIVGVVLVAWSYTPKGKRWLNSL